MGEIDYTGLDWRGTILLGTALRDGLVEAVAGGCRPAAEVARRLGMDEPAVYAVLSALAELGVLDEGEGGFRLRDENRRPLLDGEYEGYIGETVMHRLGLIEGWTHLGEILKSGEPVEDRTAPSFDSMATFIGALRLTVRESAGAVAETVLRRLPAGARILDVGGGPGTNAEAFVRGGARVTVFDRPEVIRLMEGRLAAAGIETAVGDMNEALPEGPYDAIYFGNTSHMYGPEENRALFGRMRSSLAPGGLLVVREFVRGISDEAALFAVNMLVLTPRGTTYTAGEYETWLREAGFAGFEVIPIPGTGAHLILARNPR